MVKFLEFVLIYQEAALPLKLVTLTEVCGACGLGMTDLSSHKHLFARKLTWTNFYWQHSQVTHKNTYACVHMCISPGIHTQTKNIQSHLSIVEVTRSTGLLRNHFPGKQARQFHHIAKEKKAFFNGEKWQAGEELAAAARIIDGNCLGTRLRFMGRTTH